MITINEVRPQYAVIRFDGLQIGFLYKDYNSYTVEVGYTKREFKPTEKRLIKDYVLKMYLKQKDMFIRKLVKEHKLRNSIYNTNQEYTING